MFGTGTSAGSDHNLHSRHAGDAVAKLPQSGGGGKSTVAPFAVTVGSASPVGCSKYSLWKCSKQPSEQRRTDRRLGRPQRQTGVPKRPLWHLQGFAINIPAPGDDPHSGYRNLQPSGLTSAQARDSQSGEVLGLQ
ncbi:unnamed protein product [Pleuronectes platessa]|uniref:Uncharacterized protein n=1 Tax=Pleuronectes platessa TaxID=8262 RepID=A0A9N7VMG3_PLEPL|nr:unnamed protein product [Pleuronectes platessa]